YLTSRDPHTFSTRRSSDLIDRGHRLFDAAPAPDPQQIFKHHTARRPRMRIKAVIQVDRRAHLALTRQPRQNVQRQARLSGSMVRSEEHTSELQSREKLVCR